MKAIVKLILIYILRAFMRILYVVPIKYNRIIFHAYRGSQYSCNPKYISEYLTEQYPGKFEVIWAFKEPEKFAFLKKKGIKLVRYSSLKRFYYEATAKISINNIGSYSWIPVRKGQEHINTWHGGFGVKKCGIAETANSKLMKKTIQMSSDETTLLISTGREFDRDIAGKDLGYKGAVLPCGYPRNDILFRQKSGQIDLRKKVSQYFGFDVDSYVLLYAPTWRYDKSKKILQIDYKRLKDALEKKTGKSTVILTRMHHLMKTNMGDVSLTLDATSYPDMQELLAVSDGLITDYSSCIWDYSIMGKPVYLFAPDIDEYDKERGSHVSVFEWGFPVCRNNHDLLAAVNHMSDVAGRKNADTFQERGGSYERGNACEQVGKWIYERCRKKGVSCP